MAAARPVLFTLLFVPLVAACATDALDTQSDGLTAPGVDYGAQADSGPEVGHRLIAAGEYELALNAFSRTALRDGMNAEILSGLGTANLGLGRLGQAERLLRRAIADYDAWPQIYNNLGVVLMEQGKTAEAVQVFRQAFALDGGKSTLIRDNLRLALAKSEISPYTDEQNKSFTLVRKDGGAYLLRPTD